MKKAAAVLDDVRHYQQHQKVIMPVKTKVLALTLAETIPLLLCSESVDLYRLRFKYLEVIVRRLPATHIDGNIIRCSAFH